MDAPAPHFIPFVLFLYLILLLLLFFKQKCARVNADTLATPSDSASKSSVRLTIETHYVGDVRLIGNRGAVLEGYQLKSLNGLLERKFDLMEDMIYLERDHNGRIR